MATTNTWNQIVSKITGVVNRGALNWSGSNTTYILSSGYYTGGTLDSRPSYTNGYNNGVSAADNRVNTSSASYSTGYNNGYSAGNSAGYNNGYNNGVNAGKTSFTLTVVSGWPDSQYQTFGASVGAYYIAAMGGDPGYFNEFAVSGATVTSNVTTGSTPPDGMNFARMVTMRATSGQITVNWGDTLGYGGGGIVCRVN